MKILYHQPSLDTITAGRTIYNGYKYAFSDMGHTFYTFTAGMKLSEFYNDVPDIFITGAHFFHTRQIDQVELDRLRSKGMKVFVSTPFWSSPFISGRINEAPCLKNDKDLVAKIRNNILGDIFFTSTDFNDKRMVGFEENTGKKLYTVPLAADKSMMQNINFDKKFSADISYIGTNLPQKRKFFKEWLFPLKNKYDLKLYGQDWTILDRSLGWIQKAGQLFNVPIIRSIRKPKLRLQDEAIVYNSSKVCVNIHEDYQREFGGDCNERVFKIPAYGGFQICDDVECVKKYFKEGEEIIIAKDKDDWFSKIEYYMNHPEERENIIKAGYDRVLRDHTYHNRAQQIINIYNSNNTK